MGLFLFERKLRSKKLRFFFTPWRGVVACKGFIYSFLFRFSVFFVNNISRVIIYSLAVALNQAPPTPGR